MDTLRIRWSGGEAAFEPGTTVRIGRDVDADVQLTNSNVSRRHVEIVADGTGWVLRDVGSAQGTWRDGRQIDSVEVRGTIQVTLGREGRGEVLTLESTPAPSRPPVDAGSTEIAGGSRPGGATEVVGVTGDAGGGHRGEGTVVVGATPNRPGGALRAESIAGATVVTTDDLNVECAGRSYAFQPGQEVWIGRDHDCDIVSVNPTVSRRHARLSNDGTGWRLHDESSAGGTFVDGQRIDELALVGSVAVWLGDETAGERMVLVARGVRPAGASGTGSSRTRRRAIAIGAVTALVVAVLAVVLLRGGDEGGPSNDELARATVRLSAGDLRGSGTIIDAERGLILTNAHVAAPDALGTGIRDHLFADELRPSTRDIDVLVAPALGKAAEPRFTANVVAVDGYLDLAVLQITKTSGGDFIEPGAHDLDDLVEVDLGSSAALRAGDALRVFGYPSASQSSGATLTEGVVSGQVQDERLGSNRGMLNISAAISPGNSGGLAVNADGELVGVPTLIRDDTVPSMRPVDYALPLIESARQGETYASPYFQPLTDEQVSGAKLVAAGASPGVAFECGHPDLTALASGNVGVSFDYSGFDNQHQDLAVAIWSGKDLIGFTTLDRTYPVVWPTPEGCATVTLPVDLSRAKDPTQPVRVQLGIGPNYAASPAA